MTQLSPAEWAALPLRDKLAALREAPGLKEDPRAAEILAGHAAAAEESGLHLWEPFPKQVSFLESKERVKEFAGGNGTGKSTVGTVDDLVQVCDERSLPQRLRRFKRWEPPVLLRVVAPTDGVLDNTVLEKFRELCPRDQLVGKGFEDSYNKQHRKLRLKNDSGVLFNTAVQDRQAHAGVELRRCRFDEEPAGDHGRGLFTENMARLRSFMPDAQIAFTMTPLAGLSWTYDEVWEHRGLEESEGVYRNPARSVFVVVASMFDNPHINAAEMIKALGHLSPEELASVVEGRYVHFHGTVLKVTDEHVVPPIEPDHLRGQDVFVGIDPGIRRGGVAWNAFDGDNTQLVFDELYPEGLTVPEIAFKIQLRNATWGVGSAAERRSGIEYARGEYQAGRLQPSDFENAMTVLATPPGAHVTYVIDPSARNRSLVDGSDVEDAFLQRGIPVFPGQNARDAGIMQLQARLAHRGLFVTENCTNWRREAQRWLVASDEILAEQKARVKGAGGRFATIGPDHLMDPTRYVAMERLWHEAPTSVSRRRDVWRPGDAIPGGLRLPEQVGAPMGFMS